MRKSICVKNSDLSGLSSYKTSIRYAKENDREKRGRRRYVDREGEIRERCKGYI